MKSILLTSTALVAFAGAAFADGHSANDGISFSGSAKLGYNDELNVAAGSDDNLGFYSELNLDVALSKALDNGITVKASADVDELDAGHADFSGITLSVASETATLTYGEVDNAAEDNFSEAGDMDQKAFTEQDSEIVLRADLTFGDVSTSASYEVDGEDLVGLQLFASVAVGSVSVSAAYESDDGLGASELYGLRAATTFAGTEVAVGYISNTTTDESSTGISVAYPLGDLTLVASYSSESVGDDNYNLSAAYSAGAAAFEVSTDENDNFEVEGSYDLGNGVVAYAGLINAGDEFYLGGTYDLGGGASVLASYVDADAAAAGANADDEFGANDYQAGTTVEVSFAF